MIFIATCLSLPSLCLLPQDGLPPLFEVVAFASTGTPMAMALGDLDDNGFDDLVMASLAEVGLELRYQDVDLIVSTPAFVGAGRGYHTVDVLDLNGDRQLDLLACSADSPGSLYSFLGDGSGSFQQLTGFVLAGQANAQAVGDLDLDGDLDLAIALVDTAQVQVLLGAGDGSFASGGIHDVSVGAQDVVLGDLDGDGKLDIVTAGGPVGAVAVLRGMGLGDFGEPSIHPALAPEAVELGDIDGDGDLDAVVATSGTKFVVLENAAGEFLEARRYDALYASRGLDLVDQDGDGNLDVILAMSDAASRYSNKAFIVSFGDGSGGFDRGPTYGISVQGDDLDAVLAQDFDSDGVIDVLTLGKDRGTVGVFRGDGAGGYLEQVSTSFPSGSTGAREILGGDFNGDGFDDLVAVNGGSLRLPRITLSNGDGTFPFGQSIGAGLIQNFAAPIDLNGDGNLDLAFSERFGGPQVAFALGDGAGLFPTWNQSKMNVDLEHVTVVDWNGDGALDILGVGSMADGVLGRLGNGAGGFLEQGDVDFALGSSLSDIASADLDGDGDGDLAMLAPSQGLLVLLFGDGSGGVQSRQDIPIGNPLFSNVRVGDLNRDGSVDLVTGGPGAAEIVLRYGSTAGTFGAPVHVPSSPADLLELADLDRDGWLDLIVFSTLRMGLHRSDGLGGYHAPQYHDGGGRLFDFSTADVDGDGWPEVLMATGRSKVSFFHNRGLRTGRLTERNGSGANVVALTPAGHPVLGAEWEIMIDPNLVANSQAVALFVTNRGSNPVHTPFGELLVALEPEGNTLFAELQLVIAGKQNAFTLSLPSDQALAGVRLSAQGTLIASQPNFTNAVDGIIGLK